MSFAAMQLDEPILRALTSAGYDAPTPIQAAAIPEVLAGRDIMASAQTGTGKTAAFMLPALHRLAATPGRPGRGPRVLVLTPTRELALQVTTAAQKYGRFLPRCKAVSVVGGMPYFAQNKLLAAPHEVLVATPGRLMDQMAGGKVDFSRLEVFVLDEADRMLDMGFIDDVTAIAAKLPATRQTLLFSATLEGRVAGLAAALLGEPVRIRIAGPQAKHEHIEQQLIASDGLEHKIKLLDHLVREPALRQAIVFTATKRDADDLADRLIGQGHAAAALHGDMQQRHRNRTLDGLRRGQVRVLVATDVAARGIDVVTISHVVNFDLPKSPEDYVHRIGRTGRAGQAGIAISLAGAKDLSLLKRIERFTGHPLAQRRIAGLEARFDPSARRPASTRGPRERAAPAGKGFGQRHGATHGGIARADARLVEGRDASRPALHGERRAANTGFSGRAGARDFAGPRRRTRESGAA